jgi:hypothetical protein
MAHYGELFNVFDPKKQDFAMYIDKYFNYPILSKTKDVNKHSIYMVKTYCLLSKYCRYIMVITLEDSNSKGHKSRLSDLNWVSFQTRTLEDKHDVDSHSYQPVMEGPLTCQIIRTKITPESSTYSCTDFPIEVNLLHKKKDIQSEYQPKGNIISALETFETIVTFN